MRRVGRRIAALEARTPIGCSNCQYWSPAIYQDDQGWGDRPECCPSCRRVVPIQLIRQIIGVSLEHL